jgi:large subunit ribosomal protein L25
MARKYNLEVVERDLKKKANVLRAEGFVPAEVYGPALKENKHIAIAEKEMSRMLEKITEASLIDLDFGNEKVTVFLKTIQRHKVSDKPIHADFYIPAEGRKMTLNIPFEVEGDPIGVTRDNGVMEVVLFEIPVEILPKDVIEEIRIDVSNLEINQHITVADIVELIPENAKVLLDEDEVLVTINKKVVSVEDEENGEESAEPEVIEEKTEE